jgi:hypothetical protein
VESKKMSNRDSNGDADADAQLTPIHVTAVLVASSGETWEIQFQADLAPGRMLSHTLSRHRSIVAHEQQVAPHSSDGAGAKGPELPSRTSKPARARLTSSARCAASSGPTFSRKLVPVLMVALAPALCSETLDEFLPWLSEQMNHRFALRFARQSRS